MKKRTKPEYKYRDKVRDIPNYGFIQVLDRGLQKQLDDLNEMKMINHIISKRGQKAI